MKSVYVLRNVGIGHTFGIYSSQEKAEGAARRLLKNWGVKTYEYKAYKYMTFFWVDDDDHERQGEGIVVDYEMVQ